MYIWGWLYKRLLFWNAPLAPPANSTANRSYENNSRQPCWQSFHFPLRAHVPEISKTWDLPVFWKCACIDTPGLSDWRKVSMVHIVIFYCLLNLLKCVGSDICVLAVLSVTLTLLKVQSTCLVFMNIVMVVVFNCSLRHVCHLGALFLCSLLYQQRAV